MGVKRKQDPPSPAFDDLIQKDSGVVSGDTQNEKVVGLEYPVEKIGREAVISDESLVMMKKKQKDDEESERDGLKGLVKSASIFSSGSMEAAGNNASKGVATASVSSLGSSYNSLAQDNNPKVEKADQYPEKTDWFAVYKKLLAFYTNSPDPFLTASMPRGYSPCSPKQRLLTPEEEEYLEHVRQKVLESDISREAAAKQEAFDFEKHWEWLKTMPPPRLSDTRSS